ncbi:hypothetical protein DENSPDRAFT_845475 [Dentipellis sp. KUC8613]|nr:hypothetical protein DENSPDRAFT_845475 [Dentipellis sp. KUC8613]
MTSYADEVEPATPKSTPDSGRAIACKNCDTFITSTNDFLSQAYWGLEGRAVLVRHIAPGAATRSAPTSQILLSGAPGDTVRVLYCRACTAYVGWEIVRAQARAERWKEGRGVLELARVCEQCVGEVRICVPLEEEGEEEEEEGRKESGKVQAQKALVYRTPEQQRKEARRIAFSRTASVLGRRQARVEVQVEVCV